MLHDQHKKWLEDRGINSGIAETLGLTTVREQDGNWLCIPYRHQGKLVNRKYRLTSDKRHKMDKGGTLCLWNADVLRSDRVLRGETVIITEGEFDALAAMTCGFQNVVSVPNGAPSERIDDPENSNRYQFLWAHKDDLANVQSFILATDGDKPGMALAHDLAHLLGPERCKFITYPEGFKDINDMLMASEVATVVDFINAAKPFPVRGLYSMSDIPEAPPVQGMDTGIDALNDLMQLVPGTMNVFTGYANMGKSTVLNTMVAHCASRGVPTCIASFETWAKPILRDGIAKAMLGCTNAEYENHPNKAAAFNRIEQMVKVVTNAMDEDLELDLETFLDTVRVAVIRDGVKVVILDPWNEIEHKRGRDETLTEYVGRAIRRIKSFAKQYNVCFWVVAHPTKPAKGTNTRPTLYDVSDSAHWSNKADYGLVYHREDTRANEAILAVVKVRMGLPGRIGQAMVKFDHRNNRINALSE